MRVTREIASKVANILAEIAYKEDVEKACKKYKEIIDNIYLSYVPSPIIACAKEYPDFFYASTSAYFSSPKAFQQWFNLSISNPLGSIPINISDKDMDRALNAELEYRTIKNEKYSYRSKVGDALYQLKTEAKIKQFFPEALPFINFSESSALVPNYDDLRSKLK